MMALRPDLARARPREAPYKVSPAKIQIFALKGGNFSVQKAENVIRVVTCP